MKQVQRTLVILVLTLLCSHLSAQTGVSDLLKKVGTIKDSMVEKYY